MNGVYGSGVYSVKFFAYDYVWHLDEQHQTLWLFRVKVKKRRGAKKQKMASVVEQWVVCAFQISTKAIANGVVTLIIPMER